MGAVVDLVAAASDGRSMSAVVAMTIAIFTIGTGVAMADTGLREIAEQTNLLALNAAIEAARG